MGIDSSASKENMEPPKQRRPEVKKPLLNKPKLNSVSKPKLILKPPGSATKKVVDLKKTPSVLKPSNKRLISATPVRNGSLPSSATPSLKNPVLASASKSLKFTPKNTGFRVAKRPLSSSTSNSETPVTNSSTTES